MKKVQIILGIVALFALVAFGVSDKSEKVQINHKGRVIEVPPQAVEAHLAHGDYIVGGNSSSASATGSSGGM
jgi:hypothetical protein